MKTHFKDPYNSNRLHLPRALCMLCSQMPNAENFQNYFSFSKFKQMLCLVLVKQLYQQYSRDNCQMWGFLVWQILSSGLSDNHRTWITYADQLLEDALLKKVVWTFCQECDTYLPWKQTQVSTIIRLTPWHLLQLLTDRSVTQYHSTAAKQGASSSF